MPIFNLSLVTDTNSFAEFLCDLLNQQEYQDGQLRARYGGGRDDDIDVIRPDGSILRFRLTVESPIQSP